MRWLDCQQPWFSLRWLCQAIIPWQSSLQLTVIGPCSMLIFSYQLLSALGTSTNVAISTALRFQYAGVFAEIYKAKLLLFTSQVMAAFQSAMFDSKQVWPLVGCYNHSLSNKVWLNSLDRFTLPISSTVVCKYAGRAGTFDPILIK